MPAWDLTKSIVVLTDGTLQVTENRVVLTDLSLLKMKFVTLKYLSSLEVLLPAVH